MGDQKPICCSLSPHADVFCAAAEHTQAIEPSIHIPNKRQHQQITSIRVSMMVCLWNIWFHDFMTSRKKKKRKESTFDAWHRLVNRWWNITSWQSFCMLPWARRSEPNSISLVSSDCWRWSRGLLMLVQRSARKCEIRWESTTGEKREMGFSSIFLFSCKWETCPTLHDYARLHPGPSLIRMSTVILHFLQLCCCWFFLQPRCLR